jgi:hypothetical protein
MRSFARRLLQVAGDDELQLNLRDAALNEAQQEAVANALFQQLHAAGMPLKRVYLNGQRYQWGEGTNAALPVRDPAGKLTDKE